jgi:hypothetical protein
MQQILPLLSHWHGHAYNPYQFQMILKIVVVESAL